MMYFPPFFHFPFYYPRYTKRHSYTPTSFLSSCKKEETIETPCLKKCEKKEGNDNNPLFEIFGLKLYFDDILLISLLFFLYSEGVDDINLYIALILLLLS